jgi:hypothetical protein
MTKPQKTVQSRAASPRAPHKLCACARHGGKTVDIWCRDAAAIGIALIYLFFWHSPFVHEKALASPDPNYYD